jgi:hypothetical protein
MAQTTTTIEDKMIALMKLLGIFKAVDSTGRENPLPPKTYPVANIYFDGDRDVSSRDNPRPVPDYFYVVQLTYKNLRGEKSAANNIYEGMDAVINLFNGSTMDLEGIQPMRYQERALVAYEAGVITYAIRFRVPVILPPVR